MSDISHDVDIIINSWHHSVSHETFIIEYIITLSGGDKYQVLIIILHVHSVWIIIILHSQMTLNTQSDDDDEQMLFFSDTEIDQNHHKDPCSQNNVLLISDLLPDALNCQFPLCLSHSVSLRRFSDLSDCVCDCSDVSSSGIIHDTHRLLQFLMLSSVFDCVLIDWELLLRLAFLKHWFNETVRADRARRLTVHHFSAIQYWQVCSAVKDEVITSVFWSAAWKGVCRNAVTRTNLETISHQVKPLTWPGALSMTHDICSSASAQSACFCSGELRVYNCMFA